jgi:hypothetical protein
MALATDKGTGKVAWETNLEDGQADVQLTAAAPRRGRKRGGV